VAPVSISPASTTSLRVCIAYDCLYPHTVGGAERWYRNLAEAFIEAGHRVTYVTRRQWAEDSPPDIPGVELVAISKREDLYDADGRRRIGPPLRFGRGLLAHLARRRGYYDVVHTCSFPYFGLPAIRLALAGTNAQVGVDWFEFWSDDYWHDYLGGVQGRVAATIQRIDARLTPTAFIASRRHGDRLRANGLRSDPLPIGGLYRGAGESEPVLEPPPTPLVLFVGRLIPEKRAELVAPVVAELRRTHPATRARIIGDGPRRAEVEATVARLGLAGVVEVAGFVGGAEVEQAMAAATCLLAPTQREGYGLVVIEAAAKGTPVVVVDGPDNAAAELVETGVNGAIAASGDPVHLADAVRQVFGGGAGLRRSTAAWFTANAEALGIEGSSRTVVATYEARSSARSQQPYDRN